MGLGTHTTSEEEGLMGPRKFLWVSQPDSHQVCPGSCPPTPTANSAVLPEQNILVFGCGKG